MLKLRLAPFAVFALCAAIALAQENAPAPVVPPPEEPKVETSAPPEASAPVETAPATPKPVKRKPKPAATPTPAPATPTPKPQGFWARVFGPKKPKATPTPATPVAKADAKTKPTTPAPKKVSSTTPKPAVVKPKATPSPDEAEATPKVAEEKPAPVEAEEKPVVVEKKATPTPKKSGKGSKPAVAKTPSNPPPDGKDPETLEKWKYDEAKGKAMGELKIQDLKAKADSAASDDDARKALRAYNKALFDRMRDIDPTIKDRVDRMESAVLRRLGE